MGVFWKEATALGKFGQINAKKKKKNGIIDLSVVESHYGMYGMLSVMVVTEEVAVVLYQVQQ